MSLRELLEMTIEANASDLHLCAGYRPKLRIDGVLTDLSAEPLTEQDMLALIEELLPAQAAASWAEDPMASAQFNYGGPRGTRFRTVAHKHVGGSAISMRLWPSSIPTVAWLGLPQPVIDRVGSARRGLVLASGPTGSGKSTAVYSLVDHINAHRAEHIVWISEPAEFILEPKRSLIRNIEVGTHMRSFAEAARAAMRMDPDVIVIAEMRDLESIALALALAETGHLVFTTVHCATAPQAVARIIEVFPAEQQPAIARQLAHALECVLAQRLLPRATGKGRIGAYEVLFGTADARALIAERRSTELEALIASGAEGMQTLQQHVDALVREGTVDEREARLRL